MSNTMHKSAKKSSGSRVELSYDPDFWTFYTLNESTIDRWIDGTIFRLTHSEDPDLRNDVLVVLHDRNVLGSYDPSKARLNTYLTTCIHNAVVSLLRKESTRTRWKAWHGQRLDNQEYLRAEVVPDTTVAVESQSPLLACIKKNLSKRDGMILTCMIEGICGVDTARILSCSPQAVSMRMSLIKKRCMAILNGEDK